MERWDRPSAVDEGLTLVMMRVRRSVRAVLREAAREDGLSQNEIEVLLFLACGRYDTARDLSRSRGIPRSLVSKSVDQLIRRGYVEARQDPQDRRVVRLQLLPPAQAVVVRLDRARKAFFDRLCRGITREEAESFRSMVDKMVRNLEEIFPDKRELQEGETGNEADRSIQ